MAPRRMFKPKTVEEFETRINGEWRKYVKSIRIVGNLLTQAESNLKEAELEDLHKRLPFSRETIFRLKKILPTRVLMHMCNKCPRPGEPSTN